MRCLLAIAFLCAASPSFGEVREWTSADGKSIKGEILDFSDQTIKLKTDRGVFDLPLARLSKADQEFAKTWADSNEATTQDEDKEKGIERAQELGDFENLKLGNWPKYISADFELDEIQILSEEEVKTLRESDEEYEHARYIYRTPHFEFHSPDRLSNSVVREFGRIFEASYEFVDQIPIGLAPQPNSSGYYITKLYASREDYYGDGGMQGSGGMMTMRFKDKELVSLIKVPLSSLGVQHTGTRYIVDHDRRSTTLTHEIVHQIMVRWLATSMPTWLSEGIAEVISSQDYDNGRFKLNSMDRAITEEITRGQSREFSMVGLEKLMNITSQQWANELANGAGTPNYNSSNVLAYYFLRLDGEGDGAHLVEFLKELPNTNRKELAPLQEKHLLRGRTYEELEEAVSDAWRKEGLRINF